MKNLLFALFLGGILSLPVSAEDPAFPCKLSHEKDMKPLAAILKVGPGALPEYLTGLEDSEKQALCVARGFLKLVRTRSQAKKRIFPKEIPDFEEKYLSEAELDYIEDALADVSVK